MVFGNATCTAPIWSARFCATSVGATRGDCLSPDDLGAGIMPRAGARCLPFPAVAARGAALVVNDGSGQRFFAAGYVYSGTALLIVTRDSESKLSLRPRLKVGRIASSAPQEQLKRSGICKQFWYSSGTVCPRACSPGEIRSRVL